MKTVRNWIKFKEETIHMYKYFNFSCFFIRCAKTMRTEYKTVSTSSYLWLLFLVRLFKNGAEKCSVVFLSCSKTFSLAKLYFLFRRFYYSCKLKFHKQAFKEKP